MVFAALPECQTGEPAMRRPAADANQPAIVGALRAMGASVQHLHMVGQGCPDIAVGYRGQTFLIEIKDGAKKPSDRELTGPQKAWHTSWRGHVAIAESVSDAMEIIGVGK